MRKFSLVSLFMLCMILFCQPVFAQEPIRVTIDDVTLDLPQAPIMQEEQVLIPTKPVMEKLNSTVVWDENDSIVHILNTEMALSLQNGNEIATTSNYDVAGDAYVNASSVQLLVAPKIVHGTMMVGLEDLKAFMGIKAFWDQNENVVRIYTKESESYFYYKQKLDPMPIMSEEHTADKYGVMIQVGDTVTTLGFYGTVVQISGDNLLVEWNYKAPVINEKNFQMLEFLAGIKYGQTTWIKNKEVTVSQG